MPGTGCPSARGRCIRRTTPRPRSGFPRKLGPGTRRVNSPVTIYPAHFAGEAIVVSTHLRGQGLDASTAPLFRAGGPQAAAHSFETRDRSRRGRSSGMTDATSVQGDEPSSTLSRLADLGTMLRRSDIALAVGMMTILVILIVPLPPLLLDFSLAVSIIFSVLILMTSLFIQAPLEFSAFPTVLLIATMLRLALNLASTRLILAHGHEGTAAAGYVIEAFGRFVMGGNFVIGIIVFTILVIVNFVVITKGSGRIAEVAARFH